MYEQLHRLITCRSAVFFLSHLFSLVRRFPKHTGELAAHAQLSRFLVLIKGVHSVRMATSTSRSSLPKTYQEQQQELYLLSQFIRDKEEWLESDLTSNQLVVLLEHLHTMAR